MMLSRAAEEFVAVNSHDSGRAEKPLCSVSVRHQHFRPAMDETLGAPSIERLLLDGWETTKANHLPSGLSAFHPVFV
jgi:hypothetical protein